MPSSACSATHRHSRSFPTRRSSDLAPQEHGVFPAAAARASSAVQVLQQVKIDALDITVVKGGGPDVAKWAGKNGFDLTPDTPNVLGDRKSTRLNSSHLGISYAVFCLFRHPPALTLFPYTTLFRSGPAGAWSVPRRSGQGLVGSAGPAAGEDRRARHHGREGRGPGRREVGWEERLRPHAGHTERARRSEEHTSELQSLRHLVCRLLLVPPPTGTHALSLHDALPIWPRRSMECSPPQRPGPRRQCRSCSR